MTDYQKYQLQWMLDHGYSLQDLMRELTEFQYDDPEDSDRISTPTSELFDEWEFDRGFGSEIWACEEEWREVECPQRKAVNIQWDIDPEDDDGVELPNEIAIPNDICEQRCKNPKFNFVGDNEPPKRSLWLRLGVMVRITAEEEAAIFGEDEKRSATTLENLIRSGKFSPQGDCYIPDPVVEQFNKDHSTNYTIRDYDFEM